MDDAATGSAAHPDDDDRDRRRRRHFGGRLTSALMMIVDAIDDAATTTVSATAAEGGGRGAGDGGPPAAAAPHRPRIPTLHRQEGVGPGGEARRGAAVAASSSSGGGEYGHRRNSNGMSFPMGVEEESSMTIAREFLSRLVSAVARGWDVSSRRRIYGTCIFLSACCCHPHGSFQSQYIHYDFFPSSSSHPFHVSSLSLSRSMIQRLQLLVLACFVILCLLLF
jgi:hypothetical protein